MKKQFILLTVFALFSLSLFSQNISIKRNLYDKGKLEKINKEDSLKENDLQCATIDIFDVGYKKGMGEYNKNRFFLNAISSYQIKPYLSLGYGGAVRYYYDEEAIIMPFLTEFRIDFTDITALPFLAIRFGHSFELTDSEYFKDTGFNVNISLGDKFNISNNIRINMELGYGFQEADVYNSSGLHNNVVLQAISLGVGIMRLED